MVALLGLGTFRGRCFQLSAENTIPESAGDAKAIFEISIVVLEVVLLQFLIVEGKTIHILASNYGRLGGLSGTNLLAMVKEVVSQIVANVAEDTTTEYLYGREPIVEEDCMGQLPKWGC